MLDAPAGPRRAWLMPLMVMRSFAMPLRLLIERRHHAMSPRFALRRIVTQIGGPSANRPKPAALAGFGRAAKPACRKPAPAIHYGPRSNN